MTSCRGRLAFSSSNYSWEFTTAAGCLSSTQVDFIESFFMIAVKSDPWGPITIPRWAAFLTDVEKAWNYAAKSGDIHSLLTLPSPPRNFTSPAVLKWSLILFRSGYIFCKRLHPANTHQTARGTLPWILPTLSQIGPKINGALSWLSPFKSLLNLFDNVLGSFSLRRLFSLPPSWSRSKWWSAILRRQFLPGLDLFVQIWIFCKPQYLHHVEVFFQTLHM